ncbi:MAG TPA: monofunctional biosynthetic peptidoglycan transglycosylase [Kofleriaceae bacterium]|nr:monofunctional biosynthetic peptidoglycan transglycosylase [Kofleriaceae bacterium]
MQWQPARPASSPARRPRRWLLGALLLGALAALGAAGAIWWTLPDVGPLARVNPQTTAFIEIRRASAREAKKPFHLKWRWRRLGDISPYLRHAVISAEDARFWQHDGVDWEAVRDAAEYNWEEKRLARGASTITQQVAKNLYLTPSRNPLRKLRELLITWRLEDRLSKRRLLEIYLNIAEWGDAVFGAEAAAQHWFGCSAAELSPAQAARLAVALPNPRAFSPAHRAPALDRKAERLLRAMRRDHLISGTQYDRAMAEVTSLHRTALR